jgi:hypothetical protein
MVAFQLHVHHLAGVGAFHALQDGLERQHLASLQRLAGALMVFLVGMGRAACRPARPG